MAEALTEALLSRIEDASLNASAPPQQRWLDGWIVRYSPGKARRARCINAVAAGCLPLAQKLELAGAVFRAAALPMVARITRFSRPTSLDAELGELGWPAVDLTRVQVLPRLDKMPASSGWQGLSLERLPPEEYAEVVGLMRGSALEQRRAHAQRLLHSPVPYQGFVLRRDGEGAVLAAGQFVRESEIVGLYDVHTLESERGQGLASRLCRCLLALAAAEGATVAYLQVQNSNAQALSVYQRLGFIDGYTYHYREVPAH